MSNTRPIIDYRLATGDSAGELNGEVESLLANGFQPFGGVSVCALFEPDAEAFRKSSPHYTQAMIKYDPDDVLPEKF